MAVHTGTPQGDRHPEVDWQAAERSPEFQELIGRQRRFVVPATIFFLAWYLGFVALCGYAPDFMGESIYEGFTVGYALALSQFVMTWFMGWLYLRKADREFDPLRRRAADRALEAARMPRTGRFRHAEDGAPAEATLDRAATTDREAAR